MSARQSGRYHAQFVAQDGTGRAAPAAFSLRNLDGAMLVSRHKKFVENLAAAFHAHDWTDRELRKAANLATGKRYSWANSLIKRLLGACNEKPTFPVLAAFLAADAGLSSICKKMNRGDSRYGFFPVQALFFPPSEPIQRPSWATDLPSLATPASLAAWLQISPGRLSWLADPSGRNRLHPKGPLRTYKYRWVTKKNGRARLLEIPTLLLKRTQRKLLDDLLNLVPTHPSAHGFRSGRSAVTNASLHCGRAAVISFDIADFFPSVVVGRVYALFRTLGYPFTVAKLLAGLCTTRLPRDVWDKRPSPVLDGSDHSHWQRLGARHLPQGAPTSPAIANFVAFRLDCRLSGLAADLDATYTRYADDMTFSGGPDLARRAKRLNILVAQIALEEGFSLNHRKTRIQCRGGRQTVTGIVVNERPNLPRVEFDLLKAILTNCIRCGPATQNKENLADFRAHLMGKVAHAGAINPVRGRKLWWLFDRINWPVNDQGGTETCTRERSQ
jgi:RNA-directed DNA polymerase